MGWPFAWNTWGGCAHFNNIILANCLEELLQNHSNKTIEEKVK
jgi:hypothetical protein